MLSGEIGDMKRTGAEAHPYCCVCGRTERAAEKGMVSSVPQERASGAKARVGFASLMPGMNPRPTARTSFRLTASLVTPKFNA